MTFKLGDSIREGFNTLKLEYSYKDADDKPQTEQTAVYILNVQNQNSDAKSRPKLIVDSFTLSEEELRAGSTFDFTFKLRNTHASKTAKNITVTTRNQAPGSEAPGVNFPPPGVLPGAPLSHRPSRYLPATYPHTRKPP